MAVGKPRKRRRLILGALAVLLVLVVGIALALPFLVDVNRYRGLIQDQAQQALGRKVSLGEMSLTILPTFGIKVTPFEVEGLVKADTVTVGAHLLPLLMGGDIEISKVILRRPEIILVRAGDGSWNFQGLVPSEAPSGPEEETGSQEAERAFSLSRLEIADGLVHLRSERSGGPPLRIDLGLSLEGSMQLSRAGDLEASVQGELDSEGLQVGLKGEVAQSGGEISADLEVRGARIKLARARELMAAVGQGWPLPEGLLLSDEVLLSGRMKARLPAEGPGEFSLEDATVGGVVVSVSRDRSGSWNFEKLVGEAGPGGGGPASEPPEITVRNMHLEDAMLKFRDARPGGKPAGGRRVVRADLEDLDLKVEEFRLGQPAVVRVSAKVESGGSFSFQGTVPTGFGPEAPRPLDAHVELSSLDVSAAGPYLESLAGVRLASGRITLRADLKGDYVERVTGAGSLGFEQVRLQEWPEAIAATIDFDATATDSFRKMRIARFDVRLGNSRVSVTGSIDKRGEKSIVDLKIPPAQVDAEDLASLLALSGTDVPFKFSSTAPIRVEATVRGDIVTRDNLDIEGSLDVSGATFEHPLMDQPMKEIRGRVEVGNDQFELTGFHGVIGTSDIGGSLAVTDLDAPRVTFDLTSRHADFWELMSFMREEQAPDSASASTGGAEAGNEILGRITAHGRLSIEEGSFSTLDFTDLDSTLKLERKVVRLDPVRMSLYGGSVSGSASMDLGQSPPVYSVTAHAEKIATGPLLADNLGLEDMLSGSMTGDVSITASGAGLDTVLANTRGKGDIRIEQGRVGAVNVMKILSRASGLLGEHSLEEVSGRLASEGTDFSLISASLNVGDGKIYTPNLRMVSPDVELEDDGTLNMLAGTIDLKGRIVFSDELSRSMAQEKSKAAELFWDDDVDRVVVPLTMSGPLEAPSPNIAWKTATGKLARRKVQERLRSKMEKVGLGGLFGGKKKAAAAAPPPAPPPAAPAPDAPPSQQALTGQAPSPLPAGDTAGGGLDVSISRKKFSGNFLAPDLKIDGTLTGTGITAARLVVTTRKGQKLYEKSLMDSVLAYYQNADSSKPASIGFHVKVKGRKLLSAGGRVAFEITLQDAAGHTVKRSFEVRR